MVQGATWHSLVGRRTTPRGMTPDVNRFAGLQKSPVKEAHCVSWLRVPPTQTAVACSVPFRCSAPHSASKPPSRWLADQEERVSLPW